MSGGSRLFLAAFGLSWTAAAVAGQTPNAAAVTVRVPGHANPYLAGMPNGTRADFGDRAPSESPVEVHLPVAGATAVTFVALGSVSHGPGWPPQPPDGAAVASHRAGSEHGISSVTAPMESLLGVFLGDERPDKSRAPRGLNFGGKRRDFTSLSPELRQVFFIGRGRTKEGAVRRFLIPAGATRLFLGTMDGFEWSNNTGSFVVTVELEHPDVTSNMFTVDSQVAFAKWACMPERARCTPERAMVDQRGEGVYHVLLPAHLEWGASVPTPNGGNLTVRAITGTVCLDGKPESCHGSNGAGAPAGAGFLVPFEPAGAVITKSVGGKTYFSVNDRSGEAFRQHEGYFEFDVVIR